MLWLVYLPPKFANIDITSDKTTIGRKAECNVVFSERSISAVHCAIYCVVNASAKPSVQFFVEDYSTNGTFINQRRIQKEQREKIQGGDHISFGKKSAANVATDSTSFSLEFRLFPFRAFFHLSKSKR
jgi:pSer/pThr/pTyr-binding forkhead associated (FHA) protein